MIERRLHFVSAGRLYAVGLPAVVEVAKPEPCAWIPNAPAALLGLVNFRGRVLPVADGALLLGFPPPPGPPGPEARVLVVEHPGIAGALAGILVERIAGIRPVEMAGLAPRESIAGRGLHPAVVGIAHEEGRSVMHLDLALLLGRPGEGNP